MEKYGLDQFPGNADNEEKNKYQKTLLRLISPNGDEIINAGENFLITWENEKHIKNIKLEYSPDNGSTYLLIKDRIPNTGYFEWHVPHHISSNCLVRISNANGVNPEQNILLYDFKFKINSLTFSPTHRKDFTLWLGDTNNMNPSIPEISIVQEPSGKEYICIEENIKEIGRSREFHNCWHRLKILSDYNNDKISIFLDEKPVFKNISLPPGHQFTPAVSFSTDPCDTTDVEIDDFIVRVFNSIDNENRFITLFKEDFERFDEGRFPENSGWISKEIRSLEKLISTKIIDSISVQSDSINGNKSLKINNSEKNSIIAVKHFNIPGNFPFDISDRLFEIKYNKKMEELSSQESRTSRHRPKSSDNLLAYSTTFDNENSHGPNTGNSFGSTSSTAGFGRAQSAPMIDTYYIYSFDGKLMAEYDHDGNCVKDYIYAGNKLIAEYLPQENKYYYYMSDQITSTRIITDDSGNVVYSAAHRPFGKFKDVWTKTYDPKLKFSGKEREDYSELDYFGARYYDHNSYRFISTDPKINKDKALTNPQYWNLYAYCGNNPITFFDPTGLDNYVLYDPKSFSSQAAVEAKRLRSENSETTHSIPISTEAQFKKAWSSMKDPTNVTLLFHSTLGPTAPTTISIDWRRGQYLTTNPKGFITKTAKGTPIHTLSTKSIDTLRLYICHSAETQKNIAITFAKNQGVETVIGVDGPFNYNHLTYKPRESNKLIYYVKPQYKYIDVRLVK